MRWTACPGLTSPASAGRDAQPRLEAIFDGNLHEWARPARQRCPARRAISSRPRRQGALTMPVGVGHTALQAFQLELRASRAALSAAARSALVARRALKRSCVSCKRLVGGFLCALRARCPGPAGHRRSVRSATARRPLRPSGRGWPARPPPGFRRGTPRCGCRPARWRPCRRRPACARSHRDRSGATCTRRGRFGLRFLFSSGRSSGASGTSQFTISPTASSVAAASQPASGGKSVFSWCRILVALVLRSSVPESRSRQTFAPIPMRR